MTLQGVSGAGAFEDPRALRHVIRSERLEAVLQPLAGGRMLRLRHVDHGDLLVPLQDAGFDPDQWPKAGAFPLFPFHNRLRGAAFRHDGRLIRLKPNTADGRDVMHGPAHRRPWHITGQAPGHLEMALAYKADEDWPFDFTATQCFTLAGNSLTIALSLMNSGAVTMPGGVGWHPYFRPSADGQIAIAASRQWDPFGPGKTFGAVTPGGQAEGPIPRDVTVHYSGWTRATARIEGGATISLSGDSALSCLAVLHKGPYLCLEPASHVAGALETLSDPRSGMRLLAPGETLTGVATLAVA